MIFTIIRASLIFSILLNVILCFSVVFNDGYTTKGEILEEFLDKGELFLGAVISLILSFIPDYIEKNQKVDIPDIIEIIIVIFIYAGVFLSAQFDLYYRFFWWDDFLHALSGVVLGFAGFFIMIKLNQKYRMKIRPILIVIFAFSVAISIGVIWEIFEFTMDALFGTTTQKWDLPSEFLLIGKEFQGSGLRDTMSDLILNGIGAFTASALSHALYKSSKTKTMRVIGQVMNKKI